jgi:HSP20 family molecular chaperone IbpA
MKFFLVLILVLLIVSCCSKEVDTLREKLTRGTQKYYHMIEEKFEDLKKQMIATFEGFDKKEVDSNVWHFKNIPNLWQPTSEIIETKDKFFVKLEIPGVKREDIKVEMKTSLDDKWRTLHVSGSKVSEKEEEDHYHHLKERFHGKFERLWNFAKEKLSSEVSAKYNEGVLTIELLKSKKELKKSIDLPKVEIK